MWSSRTGADRTGRAGAAFSRSARAKKEVIDGWNCFLWRCDMASAVVQLYAVQRLVVVYEVAEFVRASGKHFSNVATRNAKR